MNLLARILDAWRQRLSRSSLIARMAHLFKNANAPDKLASASTPNAIVGENQAPAWHADSKSDATRDDAAPPHRPTGPERFDENNRLPVSIIHGDGSGGPSLAESDQERSNITYPAIEKTAGPTVRSPLSRPPRSEFRVDNTELRAASGQQAVELTLSVRQLSETISEHAQNHVTRQELKRELESLRRLMENKK